MRSLQAATDVRLQIAASGAHLSEMHGMTVRRIEADGFSIDARVTMALDDDSAPGLTRALGQATIGFGEAFARLAPDIVVLLGDRYELLAAAAAAMLARIPIAHLHGGEASEGVMDEAVRHSLTKMSHLHFVAAERFRERVVQLGEDPARVWVVGATGFDQIARLEPVPRADLERDLGIALTAPLALVTYHPETLSGVDQGAAMADALAAIDGVARSIVITGVNADSGSAAVRRAAAAFAAGRPDRVAMVETLGSRRYLSVMQLADVVVGNSSSGIIEAPFVGTPTVDIGDRQRGRPRAPSVVHCATGEAAVRAALGRALSAEHRALARRRETPYGTPGAAARIAAVLRTHTLDGLLIKRFHDAGAA